MTKQIKCPDQKWFTRLAEGKVTQAQEQKLSLHLEQCGKCQAIVEKLNDLSNFLGNTVSRSSPTVGPGSNQLHQRLDELKSECIADRRSANSYMDLMPWMEPAENGKARIHEFEVLEFVGRGGMGVVFKCMDAKLQRLVALKMMSPQLLADTAAPMRFLREARSAAKINHPNVVTMHAVNEIKDLPYLVMEFVDGRSLESALANKNILNFEKIRTISKQLIAGLAAAHKQNVIHRDIKPANIMLDKSYRAKITDFGLACAVEGSRLTQTGMLVGTPEFVSPEQAAGRKPDARSDLFSLGSVIYAMCCGDSPFSSSSMMTTLDNVRSLEPRPILSVNPDIPKAFVEIVGRMLRKNPEDRFDSAAEILPLLKSNRTSISTNGAKTGHSNRHHVRWRSPVVSIASAISLAVAAVVFWFVTQPGQIDRTGLGTHGQRMEHQDSRTPDRHDDSDSVFMIRSLDDLLSALESPLGEITVEVLEPFTLEEMIAIKDRDVRIVSGGDEPIVLEVLKRDDPAFVVDQASLHLDGVSIQADWDESAEEDFEPEALIACRNDSHLFLRNSEITCFAPRSCIELDDSSIEIVDSRILGVDTGIEWFSNPGSEFLIRNSFLVASTLVHGSGFEPGKVVFEEVTGVCEQGFSLEFDNQPESFQLIANRSMLLATQTLVFVEDIEADELKESLEIFSKRSSVMGSHNWLPFVLVTFFNEETDTAVEITKPGSPFLRGARNWFFRDAGDLDFMEIIEAISDDHFQVLDELLKDYPDEELTGASIEIIRPD